MKLNHITVSKCPECGCEEVVSQVIETGVRSVHVNGQRLETRGFMCGFVVEWSPNFCSHVVRAECHSTPEWKDHLRLLDFRRKQVREAEKALSDLIMEFRRSREERVETLNWKMNEVVK